MNRSVTLNLAILIFIGATLASALHIVAWTEARAMNEVCSLLRTNYFRSDQPNVAQFLNECEDAHIGITFSRARAIQHINRRLGVIRTSHLTVFSPVENRRLWEHQGSDTGLRSRMIDGELVVIGTLEQSPARLAGLKPGDAVVTINGEQPSSSEDAQTTAGHYKIARGPNFFETELVLADMGEDLSPTLTSFNSKTGELKIPSFLPQYFEKESWLKISKGLGDYKNLVIDLRGNQGGSFPAMLRALSPFRCQAKRIGKLWHAPRDGFVPEITMKDELSAESQLDQLGQANALVLETFPSYGCFDGKVIVLTDEYTSSVSEIFAEAVKGLPNVRIWGWPTAGKVVMARWFAVGSLGGGDFAISIPIAGYEASGGAVIESEGVTPSKELHYDLSQALRGEDSWLNDAVKDLGGALK